MADSNQYLRVVLEGADYLLPSAASLAIEQREALLPQGGAGPLVAWRQGRSGRWPAYGLTSAFTLARSAHWQRAVFLDVAGQPIGIVAEEVHLLGRPDMHIAPFTPLGAPPTRFGHFFNAAWVDGARVTLVIDPRSVGEFLKSAGGA